MESSSSSRRALPHRPRASNLRHSRRGETHRLPSDVESLSHYGINILRSDITAVSNDDWLEDAIIAFWFEHLAHTVLLEMPHVLLLNPSLASILQRTQQPLDEIRNFPDFRSRTHICLPINNNRSLERQGGTHWSLLLVSVADAKAIHYDSCNGLNERPARDMMRRVERLLSLDLAFVQVGVQDGMPQQRNGVDCGVYVCSIVETLVVDRLCTTSTSDFVVVSLHGVRVDGAASRRRILDVLRRLGRGST